MNGKQILIVAPPDATLLDVTGPMEVFCRAEAYAPGTYDIAVVAAERGLRVSTKFGLEILCQGSVHDYSGPLDTVLVAGSEQGVAGLADRAFLGWLQDASMRTRRLGSVCTGAFYLAHAGLLAGRHATSHWRYLAELADTFPDVTVEPDPIFVQDGDIFTSAGITAGIDLALALVEADCGPEMSQAIARDLVVFLQRSSEQPQLSAALKHRMADHDPIRSLQRWAPDNLQALATVDDMAAFANMSTRNFARLFKQQTGATPGRYLRQLRVEAARYRAHHPAERAKVIAFNSGFGSVRSLQRGLNDASDTSITVNEARGRRGAKVS